MSDWPQFDDTRGRLGRAVLTRSVEDAAQTLQVALSLGADVALITEPGAASFGGPALFTAMRDHAIAYMGNTGGVSRPSLILDAAEDAATAHACLGHELDALVFTGGAAYFQKLAPLARARGIHLLDARPPQLDLDLVADRDEALRRWLAPA